MKHNIQHAAEAIIEDDMIVIRVPIKALPTALEVAYQAGYIDEEPCEGEPPVCVVDVQQFAKDVCRALNNDHYDDRPAIHKMLDQAMEDAINDGSLGISYND